MQLGFFPGAEEWLVLLRSVRKNLLENCDVGANQEGLESPETKCVLALLHPDIYEFVHSHSDFLDIGFFAQNPRRV
jgi:hypothetical protein